MAGPEVGKTNPHLPTLEQVAGHRLTFLEMETVAAWSMF